MTIGLRIEKLRKASDLTQEQLGDKLGVGGQAVSEWEKDDGTLYLNRKWIPSGDGTKRVNPDDLTPDVRVLDKIAGIFGVSLDFLMKGNVATAGDKKVATLIERYDGRELKKVLDANSDALAYCKRLLIENKVDIRDEYLPQMNRDRTAFVGYGVFDKDDISKFNCRALLSRGLSKAAIKYFGEAITYSDAVLCDDTEIYAKAAENLIAAERKYNEGRREQSARGYYCPSKFNEKDIDWALENLNSDLPRYYEVIIYLIENGAKYFLEYSDSNDCGCDVKKTCDMPKTKFVYRVAKDMIRLQRNISEIAIF